MPLLAAVLVLSGAAELPKAGPVPESRPEQQSQSGVERTADDKAKPKDDGPKDDGKENPGADDSAKQEAERRAKEDKDKARERPQEDGKEQAACRVELKALGATFEEAPPVEDGQACGIDKPVLLSGLPGGVKVEPQATVRCDTALQLARWMDGSVKPSLEAAMPGETITAVAQASAYVCKNRNGAENGRISEHAFGNAVDIAGFALNSGKTITIRPADKDSSLEGAFQRAITEAACLYFTTVLDPGSDAAHQNHLHLDVKERRGGYRYCW